MKSIAKLVFPALLFALFLAITPGNAAAQGRHPAYLHALSDLRAARAHLERPDHGELKHEEKEAVHQINEAIDEIKKAAVEDGKDIDDHVSVDSGLDWPGRLHRAMELLNKAHQDLEHEEDNQFAVGLQQRAFEHIDKARHEVGEAIRIVAARY
ncbi:MAG TPA: hypothetical protein VGF19_08900 [Candidatus Acidoferrum sp.]